MKIDMLGNSKWPAKKAALVCDVANLHMKIRELIKPYGWKIEEIPTRAEASLSYIRSGNSFFYIVEDTPTYSAYEAVRAIQSDPVGRLTPTIALLHETSYRDAIVFEKVLHVPTVRKPLTPSLFVSCFKKTFLTWESPTYLAIRRCAYSILNGNTDQVIPVLEKLCEMPQAAAVVVPALCKKYSENNEWKKAEDLILNSIKLHPKLPSLLLNVSDFYALARMPAQAMRFYKKLKTVCNGTSIFSFEIAQAALMMGHLDLAIEAYTEWVKNRPNHELGVQHLARLLLSEGHESVLEKTLNMNKSVVKRMVEQWEKAENTQQQPPIAS